MGFNPPISQFSTRLPISIKSGDTQIFSLKCDLVIRSFDSDKFKEIISWLKNINFLVNYKTLKTYGRNSHSFIYTLPADSLKTAALQLEKRSSNKL